MAEFISTPDNKVVVMRTDVELNLDDLVADYQSIKQAVVSLSRPNKTVPDQETLDFWNDAQDAIYYGEFHVLKVRAGALFVKVKAIRDAGLLPAEYEDEYQQLVNFIS